MKPQTKSGPNTVKEARTASNKVRRIGKHMAKHPKDKTVHGQVPTFPKVKPPTQPVKPTMMHQIGGYYQPKELRINVPATMYAVYACPPGVQLEYTHLYKDAQRRFRTKVKCRAVLVKITNNKVVQVLERKEALPMIKNAERMYKPKEQVK